MRPLPLVRRDKMLVEGAAVRLTGVQWWAVAGLVQVVQVVQGW